MMGSMCNRGELIIDDLVVSQEDPGGEGKEKKV